MSRLLFATACGLSVSLWAFSAAPAAAAENSKEVPPVLQFKVKSLEGKEVDLAKYKGKVLLIVNTASHCGFTPQYKQLEALHEKYSKDGLAILGFPCNQFLGQEPGDAKEIRDFCTRQFNVKFDLFEKVEVNGKHRAPLYRYLTSEEAYPADKGPIGWNFEKFLVGRDGKVIARFRSPIRPSNPKVIAAIEAALKSPTN